jgi:type II secretory pathway component PulJ
MLGKGKRDGFGLLEVVIALALCGILGIGITTFAVQTVTLTNRSRAHMQAVQQLENAAYWLSCDVQMAQTVTPGPNGGFPLQLTWTDADQNTYQVTFTTTGGQVQRSIVENGGPPLQTVLAKSISTTLTSCSYADGLLTFNATATFASINVSRTYKIKKRPGQM